MASQPSFAAIPVIWRGSVSTANTNRDGTGTIVTLGTAGSNGTKINTVRIKATGDPADSVVTLFLHDGTNYYLIDEFDLGNPVAGSATVTTYSDAHSFSDWVLPSGYSLRAAITAALTSGVVNVFCFGADL